MNSFLRKKKDEKGVKISYLADLVCYFFWIFCFNREVTNSVGFSDQSYNSTNAWCNFVPCFSEDFAPIFFRPKESNSPILLDGNTKPVFFFSDDDSNRLIKNLIDVYDHSDIVSTRFYNVTYSISKFTKGFFLFITTDEFILYSKKCPIQCFIIKFVAFLKNYFWHG